MNRNLLLAGCGILIAGSLGYWYLSQEKPPTRCSDYTTQSECEANNCYWYDGACHSTQPPQHGCEGACMYEGQTDCDQYGNLCVCRNGEWELQQSNSPLCITGEKHYACLPSVNKIVACVPTVGAGPDRCTVPYFSYGCFCNPPNVFCDEFHFCDQRVHRCIQLAAINISADNSNWENCFSTAKPYCTACCDNWDYSGYTCDFDLGDEWAGSTLVGQIGYEWTTPISGVSTAVYGYLEGVGWTYLGSNSGIGEGPHTILLNFAKQGLSKLRFASCSTYWVNSKPKYFYGSLS